MFCKTMFKESVRRIAAQITTNINVAVAGEIVRSAHILLLMICAISSTMRFELVLFMMCGKCEGSRRGLSHVATGEGGHNGLSHSCLNAVYQLSVVSG